MKNNKVYSSPNINILEIVPESFFLAGSGGDSGNDTITLPIFDIPVDGPGL